MRFGLGWIGVRVTLLSSLGWFGVDDDSFLRFTSCARLKDKVLRQTVHNNYVYNS